MQKIKWDQSLSVGVELIDEQHQTWIDLYNRLTEAVAAQHGVEKVSMALSFLVDYTETHFSSEETRMAESNYPDKDAHTTKHKEFKTTLDGLVQDFQEDGPTEDLAVAIDTLLGNWLVKHIRTVDMQLGSFLSAQ